MIDFFVNKYPYTDFHELNLDWLISKLLAMDNKLTNFVNLNTIKYADPIAWDITKQYEQNTVVIDSNTGIAYLSNKPVPTGVSISNTDYWSVIFDLQQIIGQITSNLTIHDNGTSPTTLDDLYTGDWILWSNELYVVLHDMYAGSALIVGSNIEKKSVEELTKSYSDNLYNILNTIIGVLSALNTTDKSSIVNAINEVYSDLNTAITAFNTKIGDLTTLLTTDKSSLVNAVNEVLSSLSTIIGDLTTLTTTDKSSIVNAINSEVTARYNADITLNNRIGDLTSLTTTDKDNAVDAINEVNTRALANYVRLERQRSVLVIGDSFAVNAYVNPGEHWTSLLASRDKYQVYNYSQGGSGFVYHQTGSVYIEDEINNAYANIANPDGIGYVVLYAGLNDYNLGATNAQIYAGVYSAIALIRSKFPYAKICYIPFNYSYTATVKYNLMSFLSAMVSAGHDQEVLTYEYGPFMFSHKMLGGCVFADGHPNAYGNEVEYNIIRNMLIGNNKPPKYMKYWTPATYQGVTMLSGIRGWIELQGYEYKLQVTLIVAPATYAQGNLRIAQITEADGSNGSFNIAWSHDLKYDGYGYDYSTLDVSFHNNVADGSLAATFAHNQTFGGTSQGYYSLSGNIIDLTV